VSFAQEAVREVGADESGSSSNQNPLFRNPALQAHKTRRFLHRFKTAFGPEPEQQFRNRICPEQAVVIIAFVRVKRIRTSRYRWLVEHLLPVNSFNGSTH